MTGKKKSSARIIIQIEFCCCCLHQVYDYEWKIRWQIDNTCVWCVSKGRMVKKIAFQRWFLNLTNKSCWHFPSKKRNDHVKRLTLKIICCCCFVLSQKMINLPLFHFFSWSKSSRIKLQVELKNRMMMTSNRIFLFLFLLLWWSGIFLHTSFMDDIFRKKWKNP